MIIYKIQNKINGKIYIGMTKHGLIRRITAHTKNKSYIGQALRKYGLQSFDISVIDEAQDWEALADKEMFWICFHDSRDPNGYNLTDGGDGLVNPTEETRKKLGTYWIGKHQSEETCQKRSQSLGSGADHHSWIGRETITCRNKNCDKTFERRPTSNQQYCDSKCMYSDPERNENLSVRHKGIKTGIVPWNKGQKGAPAWNKDIPMAENAKKKSSVSHTGKVQSEETCKKRSKKLKEAYDAGRKIPWNIGCSESDESIQKYKETLAEKRIRFTELVGKIVGDRQYDSIGRLVKIKKGSRLQLVMNS